MILWRSFEFKKKWTYKWIISLVIIHPCSWQTILNTVSQQIGAPFLSLDKFKMIYKLLQPSYKVLLQWTIFALSAIILTQFHVCVQRESYGMEIEPCLLWIVRTTLTVMPEKRLLPTTSFLLFLIKLFIQQHSHFIHSHSYQPISFSYLVYLGSSFGKELLSTTDLAMSVLCHHELVFNSLASYTKTSCVMQGQ